MRTPVRISIVGVSIAAITAAIIYFKDDGNLSINGSNITSANNISSESGNVTIIQNPQKTEKIEIPQFSGEIQPSSNNIDFSNYKLSVNFNEFMMNNVGGVVRLDVFPFYTDEDLESGSYVQFEKPKVMTINDTPYQGDMGGTEYIIMDNENLYIDAKPEARRVVGYFSILGAQGPQNGFLSISLKPISIETAFLLKK